VNDEDELKIYVDLWKQTVEVQKHFNDIELRIRGLALTALTFTLGAAAVTIKDGTEVIVFGAHVQLAAVILFLGAILWLAFYFIDGVWYHRLLLGSVIHGGELEARIAKKILLGGDDGKIGLTDQISVTSPYPIRVGVGRFTASWNIHSSTKLKLFYWLVAAMLFAFGLVSLSADKSDRNATSGSAAPVSAVTDRLVPRDGPPSELGTTRPRARLAALRSDRPAVGFPSCNGADPDRLSQD
jgi:hypothetical protein